jgi:hypothetical protein
MLEEKLLQHCWYFEKFREYNLFQPKKLKTHLFIQLIQCGGYFIMKLSKEEKNEIES